MPDPDHQLDARRLEAELARHVRGDVAFSNGDRALYATDASNYREVPIGVVRPRTTDDLIRAIEICRAHDAPIVNRGAGTSIGGQAANAAVVIDSSRYLDAIVEIDPDARVARVQPGVILDELRRAAAPHGLTFGPDPSTHARCTLGGMIGNDACGAHSVRWGKTRDNVAALDVVTYRGERLGLGPGALPEAHPILQQLARLEAGGRDLIRSAFPELPRRVSGYNLDALLPEHDFDVVSALVGTEGTCATVVEATVKLVEAPRNVAMLVLGFPDMAAGADAVTTLLPHEPLAMEGIDVRVVDALPPTMRWMSRSLPDGDAWLLLEFAGETRAEAERAATTAARECLAVSAALSQVVVPDPAEQRNLWSIREVGAGLTSRFPDGANAWPGWEDAAVPPETLGGYLRDFEALMERHGRRGVPYGHFGDGCVHVRIDFDLLTPQGTADFRTFMEEAADLVVSYGGSLSGEHGDGVARAELLDRMYAPEIIDLFRRFKRIWDPDGRMNPGRIVDPHPLDERLRLHVAVAHDAPAGGFAFESPDGWAGELRRCIGVGKCVQTDPGGGVMCPSFVVTRDEQHSTRGRAHLLYEMMVGEVVEDGWASETVDEALDLCLACKGCKSDCPVQVDMAAYKAEFLHHRHRGKIRPRSHYSMGWLPVWLRLAAPVAGIVNRLANVGWLGRIARTVAGIDPARPFPELHAPYTSTWHRRSPPPRPDVVLWPDTFSNHLSPDVLGDAVTVLESVGEVAIPEGRVCCGLTWISTGQLDRARKVLGRSLDAIEPYLDGSTPIVGLEPSCTAALKDDLERLLPDDPRASLLAGQVRTFAEYLNDVGFELPADADEPHPPALVQTHCHQHAVLGRTVDDELMERLAIPFERLASGCCGLAGNFGYEDGHHAMSMAIGERVLLPRVRAAEPGTPILADGFSCRTQIEQGTGTKAVHLAQVIASRIR